MRTLIAILLCTASSWAAPWSGGGMNRPPLGSMPQMRILNQDSPGQLDDLKAELTPEKYNIVDFFADW
ncbi:hypothetical protein JST97_10390 [bacterium]|nr:hypothetical protein [bacterium]